MVFLKSYNCFFGQKQSPDLQNIKNSYFYISAFIRINISFNYLGLIIADNQLHKKQHSQIRTVFESYILY